MLKQVFTVLCSLLNLVICSLYKSFIHLANVITANCMEQPSGFLVILSNLPVLEGSCYLFNTSVSI
jgi:hypothetical protein